LVYVCTLKLEFLIYVSFTCHVKPLLGCVYVCVCVCDKLWNSNAALYVLFIHVKNMILFKKIIVTQILFEYVLLALNI